MDLKHEKPESPAGERFKAMIARGFDEYRNKFEGKKGHLAQAAAWGTAARFAGMGLTVAESAAGGTGLISELLRAWEHKETAFSSGASGLFDRSFGDIHDRIFGAPGSVSGAEAGGLFDPTSEVPVGGGGVEIPESNSEIIDSDFEPVSGDGFGDSAMSSETIPDSEVIMFPDHIPSEALVTKGDGITQALLSCVEARPNLLHSAEQAALGYDYTAALLMRRIAAKDGLLDYWISEKAIGNLAIVPRYEADGLHAAFLNPATGTAYSVPELIKLGWLVKAQK